MRELRFHPHPTGWVNERVYAITQRGMVSLFLVRTPQGALAIDTGQSASGIPAALQAAGIAAESVGQVFLTHSDSDHTGGLGAFPQARVYLGADEEPLIAHRRTRFLGLTHVPRLTVPYVTLTDRQEVRAGGLTVQVIATPGHTPGSLSYLVDGQFLFTGDTIALHDGVAQPGPSLLNMDQAALQQSLHKLAQLTGISLLCTAHTGCTTDWNRAIAPWRVVAR